MTWLRHTLLFITLPLSCVLCELASARDYISIVGSSTVYPFTTVVAERFGRRTEFSTPRVESSGTGGGFKLFCGGLGTFYPDATNASRPIKPSELKLCRANGVDDIIELKVGYDGIVFASSRQGEPFELSTRDLFLALARDIPGADGTLLTNPHTHWSNVNKDLPEVPIEVLGPPPTSGTRDAFVEVAMEHGASQVAALAGLQHAAPSDVAAHLDRLGIHTETTSADAWPSGTEVFASIAHSVREDGAYIEAGENDNLIIQKLKANPMALGIFGFSSLNQNTTSLHGNTINGVSPSFENIASGEYRISRPLYLYVKMAHIAVIPGLSEFLAEYTSNNAWGPEGYLSDKGLIPMSNEERSIYLQRFRSRESL